MSTFKDRTEQAARIVGAVRERLDEGWGWERITGFVAGMLDSQAEQPTRPASFLQGEMQPQDGEK